MKNSYKEYNIKLLKKKPLLLIISIFVNIMIFSYAAYNAYFIRKILNAIENGVPGNAKLINIIFISLIFMLFGAIIRIIVIYISALIDYKRRYYFDNLVRKNIVKSIYKNQNLKQVVGNSGKSFEIVDDDVENANEPFANAPEVIGYACFTVVAITMLLLINYKVTLMVFLPFSIAVLIINLQSKKIKDNVSKNRKINDQISQNISDIVNSTLSIKNTNSNKYVLDNYIKQNKSRIKIDLDNLKFDLKLNFILQLTVTTGSIIMMFFIAYYVSGGNLTIGDFSMFVTYLGVLYSCIDRIIEEISFLKKGEVSYSRIAKLSENADILIEYKNDDYKKELVIQSCNLKVDSLTYLYDDNIGIKDISFEINDGDTLAIVGGVGSGKTTLIDTLIGILPIQSGNIYWNDKKINNVFDNMKYPSVFYSPQDFKLFNDSMVENLKYDRNYTNDEVKQSLINSYLYDDKSDRLNEKIGNNGNQLSGGERQRLQLAKMYLSNCPLNIFDDSTSALDIETENKFWNKYFSNSHSTNIIISNRKKILEKANKILVLKDGKIIGSGTYNELINNCDEFKNICY
jgi:ATP-binding cassette subfamily B protein